MLAGCVERRSDGIIARSDVSMGSVTDAHFVRDFTVATGQPGIVNTWFMLNRDCSVVGQVTVRVQDISAHGTVTIEPGAYYSNYAVGGQRHTCNMRPRQGVRAIYHPVDGAVGPDGFSILVIWLSGDPEAVMRWDLPTAASFATAICRTCGTPVPHATWNGQLMIVPAGTLDDDPGIWPRRQIFTASQAAWCIDLENVPAET